MSSSHTTDEIYHALRQIQKSLLMSLRSHIHSLNTSSKFENRLYEWTDYNTPVDKTDFRFGVYSVSISTEILMFSHSIIIKTQISGELVKELTLIANIDETISFAQGNPSTIQVKNFAPHYISIVGEYLREHEAEKFGEFVKRRSDASKYS